MRNVLVSCPTMASPNGFLDSVQENVYPKIVLSYVQHKYYRKFKKASETFVDTLLLTSFPIDVRFNLINNCYF